MCYDFAVLFSSEMVPVPVLNPLIQFSKRKILSKECVTGIPVTVSSHSIILLS